MARIATVAAAVFLAVAAVVLAQNAPHPLSQLGRSSPDVETVYMFAKQQSELPLGEPIEILCGFVNAGSVPFNVSGIMGSLNHPQQFSFYIQNFTGRFINDTVPPGSEVTLAYSFAADPRLDPSEYQLAFTVFYHTENEAFTTTYFNETRTFYDPSSAIDMPTIFKYVAILAAAGGAFVYFTRGSSSSSASTGSSRPSKAAAAAAAEAPVSAGSADEEWLPEHMRSRSGKKAVRK